MIQDRFKKEKTLAGNVLAACLHVTIETPVSRKPPEAAKIAHNGKSTF
jgi:S-adenosylhomocysteine hydrolase